LAYFEEARGAVPTAVYDRYRLRPGDRVEGPAIIEERESTLVVGPGSRVTMDAHGSLIVDPPAAGAKEAA
jgi:N-methylhydantoinase A